MSAGPPLQPIVIAHRGASGYRPEHTIAAYEMAIDLGADFIEPDLVATRDGVLVARHENAIAITDPIREATTDVMDRAEFASRKATKVIDGISVTGWFTEDFTLEELRTLRVIERMPQIRPRNVEHDRRYQVPTFDEILELARRRKVGVYPETKHPTYFRSIGLPIEERLLAALRDFDGPVFIQSFEPGNLRMLRDLTALPLIQLISDEKPWAHMATPAGLRDIAGYADGIGPHKDYVIPRDRSGNLTSPARFLGEAHELDLLVHPWTFRSENYFLPRDLRRGGDADYGDHASEYERFLAAGIDGLFSDHPDHAVEVRERHRIG